MESQLHRPAEQQTYDADPHTVSLHSVVDEGEQQHQGKKSVLKKVKDKAKKIKDKLTPGHEHEQGHDEQERGSQPDEYEEAEEGDDEGLVQDPEIHGAPMYESVAVKNAIPTQFRGVNLEKPTTVGEDRYEHDPDRRDDRIEGGKKVGSAQEKPKLGTVLAGGLQEDPQAPKIRHDDIPSPNYESKVSDPSGKGGKEIDVNPLISKFDKMGVSEEKPEIESEQGKYAGTHDQFLPQSTPTEGEFSPTGKSTSDQSGTGTGTGSGGGGYVEKISGATSVLADKAISAKNVVASKLGYGGGAVENKGQTEDQGSKGQTGAPAPSATGSETGYVQKAAATVSETLAPVYEKVAGAGTAVVSKVKGTGAAGPGTEGTDKGTSVTGYLAEKLKPGEEDKALSEMISDTLHKKKEAYVGPKTGQQESKSVPVGKVTETEEVRRNLGSGMENKREGEDAIAAGKESVASGGRGGSVMEKITGAVTSWISKGNEQEYTKGAADSSYMDNQATGSTGEVGHQPEAAAVSDNQRRVQESGN